jgi:hypothetical protein
LRRFLLFSSGTEGSASRRPGTVIELSEVAGPKGEMLRLIREAGANWDGKDPVRPFPDLSKL